MSDIAAIKEKVYSDVISVVTDYTTNPDAHVIVEDDGEPDEPPMVALDGSDSQRTGQTATNAIHDVRVLEVDTSPFDVVYGRERSYSVDMTISDVDGSRQDNIATDLKNVFEYNGRFRDPERFLSSVPIDDVRIVDMTPTDSGKRWASALGLEIDYIRTFRWSDVESPPSVVKRIVTDYDIDDDSDDTDVIVETTADSATYTKN